MKPPTQDTPGITRAQDSPTQSRTDQKGSGEGRPAQAGVLAPAGVLGERPLKARAATTVDDASSKDTRGIWSRT